MSRQIATLEEELQVPLFVRGARGLKLTEEGAQLARGVGAAFDTLRSAWYEIQSLRCAPSNPPFTRKPNSVENCQGDPEVNRNQWIGK